MRGEAGAPAHITSFFAVPVNQPWHQPLLCGSTGGGICLDRGALARVSLSDDPYINISHNQKVVQDPLVEMVLKSLLPPGWGGDVDLHLALPLGAGLGMSGACALATALATLMALTELEDTPLPGEPLPAKAVANAHIAEVHHRTGLGDVAAAAACFGAGQPLEVRRFPGVADLRKNVATFPAAPAAAPAVAPPAAPATEATPAAKAAAAAEAATPAKSPEIVLCLTGAKVSTKAALDDEERMEALRRAAARVKRAMPETPTAADLARLGRRFAADAGLVDDKLKAALEAVDGLEGTEASVSLLGATLYGVGDVEGLREAWEDYGEVVVCGLL